MTKAPRASPAPAQRAKVQRWAETHRCAVPRRGRGGPGIDGPRPLTLTSGPAHEPDSVCGGSEQPSGNQGLEARGWQPSPRGSPAGYPGLSRHRAKRRRLSEAGLPESPEQDKPPPPRADTGAAGARTAGLQPHPAPCRSRGPGVGTQLMPRLPEVLLYSVHFSLRSHLGAAPDPADGTLGSARSAQERPLQRPPPSAPQGHGAQKAPRPLTCAESPQT